MIDRMCEEKRAWIEFRRIQEQQRVDRALLGIRAEFYIDGFGGWGVGGCKNVQQIGDGELVPRVFEVQTIADIDIERVHHPFMDYKLSGPISFPAK